MKFIRRYIDIDLLKYLVAFYTIFVAINLSKKIYFKMNRLGGLETISWSDLIIYNVLFDWVSVIIFMVLVSYLTRRMFVNEMPLSKIISIHLFLSFLISFFVFFIAASLVFIINGGSVLDIIENLSITHFFTVIEVNFLIYFTMLGIIVVYYYIKKVKNIELRSAHLQASLAKVKLNSLKSQIKPHFVFNTLNSISSLIDIDKEKSQDMIANFGDLFREIIDLNEQHLITLRVELEMLKKYIDIISVRFEDHLRIQVENRLDDAICNLLVPALLIQPIIENSVKHGYSFRHTDLQIKLSIFCENQLLHFIIENNGQLLSSDLEGLLSNGSGLKNIHERLESLYGDHFKFDMSNLKTEIGVRTSIKIPLNYKSVVF